MTVSWIFFLCPIGYRLADYEEVSEDEILFFPPSLILLSIVYLP
jgi:hypothetical protein